MGVKSVDNGRLFRLLLVTPSYFPKAGGVQTHVAEVGKRLSQRGVDVTVLTTNPQENLPVEELVDGIRILRVRAWPTKKDYYFSPGIYRTIRGGNYSIVHCQSVHTLVAPLAMLAALTSRTPYVVTFHTGGHSSSFRNRLRPLQWLILRPLLSRAKRLVAVSRFEADLFRRSLSLPEDRLAVIPNGSQITFSPDHQMERINGDPMILSVGRIERYKGHQRVLETLPKIREHFPSVRLKIVGSGTFEPNLRQTARRLGIADRVEIFSIDPDDRLGMADVLTKASLVTLLSEYEAHPISVMEALALGRPVLVANTSGLQELADTGMVTAVPLDCTADHLASAIVAMIREPKQPVHIDLPTWENCTSRLMEVYEEIIQGNQCGY